MNSVVVRLVGGLGNQMFQYAAARSLSARIGSSLELDLSWFGTDPDRQYALAPFSISANIYKSQTNVEGVGGWMAKVARRLRFASLDGLPVFSEASFLYDSRIEKVNSPVFLDGYFQTEKYFASIRRDIVDDFFLKTLPIPAAIEVLNQIASKDAICVHIRRGDYITNPTANAYHGVCSLDYYRDGIRYISSNLGNPHCFVFSDDPDWVRENFNIDIPATLVDFNRADQAHEDLRLMAACKHFVVANSSLSWWGAWLGKDANKIVVAPAKWFATNHIDTTDLIPSDWLRL
jgi:hypothetical protein